MKQIAPINDKGQVSVHADIYNTYIVDGNAYYLYCNRCGHLKTIHPLNNKSDYQMVPKMIRDSAILCVCHREKKEPMDTERLVTCLLHDINTALQHCETVEEVQEMLWEVASREEIKAHD